MKIPILMLLGLEHTVALVASLVPAELWLIICPGAPETYRQDETLESFPVQVRSNVDIWSMGCVLSEAAVWSRFAWNRVHEYQLERKEEVKRRLDINGEHLFHDGRDLLAAVQDMHELIIKNPRTINSITVEILRLLRDDMLLNEDEVRSSAKQVFQKPRRIIKAARKKFEISTAEVSLTDDKNDGNANDQDERPMSPPDVPPGYVSGSRASHRNPTRTLAGTSSSPRPMSVDTFGQSSPSLQSATASRKYRSKAAHESHQVQPDGAFGAFHSNAIDLHDLPDPPSPATSYRSSQMSRFNALSVNARDVDQKQKRRRPHRETVGGNTIKSNKTEQDKASLRRNQTGQKSSNQSHRSSFESFTSSSSDPPPPDHDKDPPTPPTSSSSNNHHSKSASSDAENQTSPKSKDQQCLEEPQRPHLSLKEGLSWKGKENLTYMNGRDHVGFDQSMILYTESLLTPTLVIRD